MDQCKHCTARGNIEKCLETACNYHGLWMVKEIKRVFKNQQVLTDSLLGAIECIVNGEEVSGFELSFPIVKAVNDLKHITKGEIHVAIKAYPRNSSRSL